MSRHVNQQARRAAFLEEMKLGPLWQSKARLAGQATDETTVAVPDSHASAMPVTADTILPAAREQKPDLPTIALADEAGAAEAGTGAEIALMNWSQLEAAVSHCTRCALCQTRTQTVFGVGDRQAKWLFVGEGPGRNEDAQGLPFIGPAGKLLDNMLLAMGLRRGDNAYIANAVKCRPTDSNKRDRPPVAEEIDACMPYLQRQIALINPSVIVALGKSAALALLALDPATPVSKLRGTVHRYAERPLIVTYHPAYLLRTPGDKHKTWADLCLAMQSMAGSIDDSSM
jgi:DNA polymerase